MMLSAPSGWEEPSMFMMEYDFYACHKQFVVAYETGWGAEGAASQETGSKR
jgi:hypothetical protein